MVNIKLEGPGADIVGTITTQRLRDSGLEVRFWTNVKPSEVAKCRHTATTKRADVCVLAMSR